MKKKSKALGFKPIELCEGNVQAIFNRCIASKNSTDIIGPILFSKKNRISRRFKTNYF
jgi:hypothetical protein